MEVTKQGSDSDIDTSSDSESDLVVRPHITGQTEKSKLLDLDQDVYVININQAACEEQNNRETMYGIHSYLGCTHIPDMHSAASSAEDNPFAAPKQQPADMIIVNLPTDD